MSKYKVLLHFPDDESEDFYLDEYFKSESEAEDAAWEAIGDYRLGMQMFHLSNPGDYPLEDAETEVEYEIIKI